MPYTLKPNKLFAKDPNGDGYLPQNVITDKSTSDAVAEIEETGTTQNNRLTTTGNAQEDRVNAAGRTQVNAITAKATELETLMDDADAAIAKIDALDDIISGLRSLLDLVHPVGSIYISKDPTDPGDMFGGVWSPITDRFLLTAGSTYHVGDADGGEATHTLTASELPTHTHYAKGNNSTENDNWTIPAVRNISGSSGILTVSQGMDRVVPASKFESDASWGNFYLSSETGGITGTAGTAHNNLPPYTIVYAWERVQ